MFRQAPRAIFFLLAILVLAAFFRFYQLDQIPPGLYPDEALNANQAITEPGRIFYTDNNGREGLFINLLWLSFSLFGISVWSFKIVPAFFGTLTVLGTYLLAKELFLDERSQITNSKSQTNSKTQNTNSKYLGIWSLEFGISRSNFIALLSSFFVATSFWHVNFSRIGFRAILLPFVLVFSFYSLFRGIRTKRLLDFILAGILFGLGFYTYTSFRMAVLLLPIPLLYFWLVNRKNFSKQFLILNSSFLILVFIVALPIGIYFLQHPADFASRAAPISIFAQENPLRAFAESFVRHLAMFNFYGDPNWRHNYSTSPQLLWPVGLLFLLGIIIAVREILRPIFSIQFQQKHSNILQNVGMFLLDKYINRALLIYLFLLSWLAIMLLPGVLTHEGLPHALRTIGVIPVPYIFAAVGAAAIWQWLLAKNVSKKVLISLAIIFIAGLTFTEYHKYFIAWSKKDEVKSAFADYYVLVGDYLNSLPHEVKKYVIVNEYGAPLYGISIPAQTPMFIERTKYGSLRAEYIRAEDLSKISPLPGKTVIVPLYPESTIQPLQENFLEGKLKKINGIIVLEI